MFSLPNWLNTIEQEYRATNTIIVGQLPLIFNYREQLTDAEYKRLVREDLIRGQALRVALNTNYCPCLQRAESLVSCFDFEGTPESIRSLIKNRMRKIISHPIFRAMKELQKHQAASQPDRLDKMPIPPQTSRPYK